MKNSIIASFFLCSCFFLTQSFALASPADEDSLAYTLERAAGRGDINEVRKLLGQESRFDNDDYYYGKIMAFVEAAQFGQHSIMRLLLKHGVKVDDVDDGGDLTALSAAASKGRLKTMRLLLDLGAQVNIAPDPGGSTPLMYAADHGQVEAMQLLLSHGAKVNAYDDNGRTALMYAAEKGSLPAVKLLLKNKADINLHPTEEEYHSFIDTMAWSPLMFAAYQGHLPVVQYLLDQGAHVNAKGNEGTAFLLACWKGHPAVAKLLFAKGAHIQGTYNGYKPALELAAASGSVELVQFLLEKGADVNAQMPKDHSEATYCDCYTALMQASAHGHTDIVKLLLKHKADTSKTDKKGRTARDLAQENGHAHIVTLLTTSTSKK